MEKQTYVKLICPDCGVGKEVLKGMQVYCGCTGKWKELEEIAIHRTTPKKGIDDTGPEAP